ncbi:chaperonin-like RBCX protein 1, chloroplastic isoform X2 [Lotus japonicus]|uniref:chaperonin-like RBCX protein 1, chloroplastic isoform X2 n=1 Tax=Lotus japonicus TaxID=34305 RepID=UPI00258745D3|nr:chaperonin-like RBCX protein 1, chloroplastic isoform X2 [Lotus japonicus]
MESSPNLALSQLPSVYSAIPSSKYRNYPFWPGNKRRSSPSTRIQCNKMFVPGFGEASPEAKAANNLHNFFTYTASYNPEAYEELMDFVGRHPLDDGDKFCATMFRESSRHKNLALRIMEVRSAYCKNDFEWDNLKRLAFKKVTESNTRLMRDYISETSPTETEK